MRRAFASLIVLSAACASIANAQQSNALTEPPSAAPAAAALDRAGDASDRAADRAPRADAAVGVRSLVSSPVPAPSPVPRRADTSHNRALLVVGGVAMLVGAVVGDTPGQIIMVGGAVIGLYGLYKFLQ